MSTRRTDASPLAISAARQLERDPAAVARAGRRLVLADLATQRPSAPPPRAARLAPGAAGALARSMARQSGADPAALVTGGDAAPAPAEAAPGVDAGPGLASLPAHDRIALGSMRRTIAARLQASKQQAPHYYMTMDCRADALVDARAALNDALDEDRRLSMNDLVLWLVARTLVEHPELNAAFVDGAIARFHDVHLAFAVAVDGGLVTPVVADAGRLGLAAIARETRRLVLGARERTLAPEAFRGGTFTVSNLGMYGIDHFAAIVNPPQAAILAVAGVRREVVPRDDGGTAIERRMRLTLSVDHRAADGVAGAAFLRDLRTLLEDPRRAVL